MANELRIVCDLDGVVFDFDRTWVERHHAWFPGAKPGLRPNMPQRWGDIVKMAGFKSASGFWYWWHYSGGWEQMEVYPGAVEALWELTELGHEITYATNRPLPDGQTAAELLRLDLPRPGNLLHTERKWELKADLFLEDAPANLVRMHPRAVRIERPWNDPTQYSQWGPVLAVMPSIPDLADLPGRMGDLTGALEPA